MVCWGEEGWPVAFAYFYAVNAPTVADFKLPTWNLKTDLGCDDTLGSCMKVQAGPSTPLAWYKLPFYFPVQNYKWNYTVWEWLFENDLEYHLLKLDSVWVLWCLSIALIYYISDYYWNQSFPLVLSYVFLLQISCSRSFIYQGYRVIVINSSNLTDTISFTFCFYYFVMQKL